MVKKKISYTILRDPSGSFDAQVPSREDIIAYLRKHSNLSVAEFLLEFNYLPKGAQEGLQNRLSAMFKDDYIVLSEQGSIQVKDEGQFITGKVSANREGAGFCIPTSLNGAQPLADIYLPPHEMLKVFHGDMVQVRVVGRDFKGRLEGKIVEVVQQNMTRVVGKVIQIEQGWAIHPEDSRIKQPFMLPKLGKAKLDDIVVARILTYPTRQLLPQAEVEKVLGHVDDAHIEIDIAIHKFHIPYEFSTATQKAAKQLPKMVLPEESAQRVDLRDLPFITIDGEDARDFDDAVYCEPTTFKKGKQSFSAYRLLVAIADVSHYVTPGSAIDQDAFLRSTSVYFPRRVVPMLPESLSNGICSLNPDVDRLVLVCDMVIPTEGELAGQAVAYQFYEATIHSNARTTYDQVWSVLSDPSTEYADQLAAVLPYIYNLYQLFFILQKQRELRGAMALDTVETKIEVGLDGKIQQINPYARNDAHKIIEECMLIANTCAADFMERYQHPGLYRVHEGPPPERLKKLRDYLRMSGLLLKGGDHPTSKDYAELLDKVHKRKDSDVIQTLCLRSLQQAVYTPSNAGHFGLAYSAYAHFTSPIRRYPDLLVHRTIKAIIQGQSYIPDLNRDLSPDIPMQNKNPEAVWSFLGDWCSRNERRADEASRDVENFLKCQFMADKVGQTFSGTITGVTAFGIFVVLDDFYVEGLLRIADISSEYLIFNEILHELASENGNETYRLQDKVKVTIARVDLDARRIELLPPGHQRSRKTQANQEIAKKTASKKVAAKKVATKKTSKVKKTVSRAKRNRSSNEVKGN